ncbi:unnamed protein product [Urochloa decumbens]|uniref:DUF4220 domain-containing protein n=1 Tax=Urochloa decumbens TaxID=240449 RepID=A0ABC9D647_9POAL
MTFRIIILVFNRDEVLNPIVIQFVVAVTTLLMVIRFGLDALRHRSRSDAMKVFLITMDAVTQAMIVYSLGIMQRPSGANSYYQVWAVLLVTLRYSVKIGRPAGISLKQTPLVDLMSSFWAANILRSQAMKILKVTGWLLWSINSLRIIHGFLSSEFANNSHRENIRLLTEYMRLEHKVGAQGEGGQNPDPSTMTGYRYLVLGEAKKQKMKEEEAGRQARDTDIKGETEDIRRLVLALRDDDKKILTLEKIWRDDPAGSSDVLDEELKDLCLSFALYKLLRRRFFNLGIHEAKLERTRLLVLGILGDRPNSDSFTNSERAFRVSEAEVAFLNDFFNSRHAIIFARGFPFIRLLLSTLLIGGIGGMAVAIHSFSKVAKVDELGRVHHGVVFTWILLSFLGVKEIWEITTYVFSDWTKVLVLCKYVESPWWLRGSVAKALVGKLCRCSVWPRWHGKVGQCNLLFPTSFLFPRRRSMYLVDLSSEVKSSVINCLRDCLMRRRLDNYIERAMESAIDEKFRAIVNEAVSGVEVEGDVQTLLVWHIATCYCEIDQAQRRNVTVSRLASGKAFGQRKPNKKGDPDLQWSHYMIARTLSQYCAYVLGLVPPLVPGNSLMASSVQREVYNEMHLFFRRPDCDSSTGILLILKAYASGQIHLYRDTEKDNTILKKGAVLGNKLAEATANGRTEDLWRFLSEFWTGFVIHMAASTKAYQHKIFLSSGGELMTHLWALLSHAGILGAVQHGDQIIETVQTQGDEFDPNTQF